MVTTYRPVEVVSIHDHDPRTYSGPLFFSVAKSSRTSLAHDLGFSKSSWEVESLQEAFKSRSGFQEALESPAPVEKGVFVRVRDRYDYGASDGHKGWCESWFLTIGIIPCYGNLNVYTVTYELFVDMAHMKTYEYTFAQKGAMWTGLLPFAWVNAFTYSYPDAFQSTAYQFLRDANKDGFF